jgi:hypothetical protein
VSRLRGFGSADRPPTELKTTRTGPCARTAALTPLPGERTMWGQCRFEWIDESCSSAASSPGLG